MPSGHLDILESYGNNDTIFIKLTMRKVVEKIYQNITTTLDFIMHLPFTVLCPCLSRTPFLHYFFFELLQFHPDGLFHLHNLHLTFNIKHPK